MRDMVEEALKASEIPYEEARPGAYVVTLPGQRKLATVAWLVLGDQAMLVEAFFCRQPEENHAEFYRFLLSKNGGMYGVHFCLDDVGDVYLLGRVPLAAVTAEEIDRLLGCVLTYSDDWFNRALELGFASSIRREWEWRASRGESLKNLQAFAHFADPERP
ncbi:YbjN domain-containing protein [Nonomuraea sediminis]|uniref:YbjN domain-containing protein n=1 Tax=Nonomuraea sediminis TaxID=2835864 RepID=UPI001BDCF704|nr:YbjN domain-containing protein [Nonomuraea sediminis]